MKRNCLLLVLLLAVLTSNAQNTFGYSKVIAPKDRICFALYTVHGGILKLTAQMYPILNYEPYEVSLEIWEEGAWVEKSVAEIIYPGYTAHFRLENWDDSQQRKYRVVHNQTAYYEGLIQRNPLEKETFVMAAFTCNSIYPQHGGDIPRTDIVENMKRIQPDLLFFSGDQVYDHSQHLLHWLRFGEDFGEIIRNTPTICLPDDHDIGQANLWGANGKKAASRRGITGGYYMPAEYVKEVERAQTSHLPDPFDPTPIQQGIGVYYTALTWGGISFAILEDRKFKSGPNVAFADESKATEAILDSAIDTRMFDVSEAKLLGDRQLRFLEHWSEDWEGAEMKTVLSQTIFAQGNNYSGKHGRVIYGDFDTNGWPQAGRNKALSLIRKSFSCMIGGDQHLGTVIHHGIEDWNDAGYSFCTPAIANLWPRWWQPQQAARNAKPGMNPWLGEFEDGFHNKITMHAVANPTLPDNQEGGKLNTRAAGFGVVRYDKPARSITFECWPRNVDITDPSSAQYPGWPVTISQQDNYPLSDEFVLPSLKISKPDQVITVKEAYTGELVYALRIKGDHFQPQVPKSGAYTLIIGEKEPVTLFEIQASSQSNEIIEVNLPD